MVHRQTADNENNSCIHIKINPNPTTSTVNTPATGIANTTHEPTTPRGQADTLQAIFGPPPRQEFEHRISCNTGQIAQSLQTEICKLIYIQHSSTDRQSTNWRSSDMSRITYPPNSSVRSILYPLHEPTSPHLNEHVQTTIRLIYSY